MSDYVKQLEETVEKLRNKLDTCVRDNEGLSMRCKMLEKYQPKLTPFLNGYLLDINKAAIARMVEEKNSDDKVVGYVLWIGDSRVCTVANVEDGRQILQEWLDTGYNGIPLCG